MKGTNRISTVAAIACGIFALVAGGMAYGELTSFDGIEGQDHHAHLYKRDRCDACHGDATPTGYPEDGACLQCHQVEDIIAATMPEAEEDRWQNPHNNLHFGDEVPCVECHGEHSTKESLCADCHNFDYAAKEE